MNACRCWRPSSSNAKDSIKQFTRGGRQGLADKEAAEIKIIEEYIPAAVPLEEINQAVTEAIVETGAKSTQEMGIVMKAVLVKFAGKRVDGKMVSEIVRSKLSA